MRGRQKSMFVVMNVPLASTLLNISLPMPEAISQFDLENSWWRPCMWSTVKVLLLALRPIDLLPFHFTSIGPANPEIRLFENVILKTPRSTSCQWSKLMATPENVVFHRYTIQVWHIGHIPQWYVWRDMITITAFLCSVVVWNMLVLSTSLRITYRYIDKIEPHWTIIFRWIRVNISQQIH